MSNRRTSGSKYVNQLTWLRGIAALFVVVTHSFRATEVSYRPGDQVNDSSWLSFFDLGTFGVVLFLVLSGCTLYLSNHNKVNGCKSVSAFYQKRFFRIWPAYVCSLLAYALFALIFGRLYGTPQGYWIEEQFLTSYSLADVMSYITLTFNITGPGGLFNNAYWSLPVEFQYYLVFPVIVLSLRYLGVIGPMAIGAALFLMPKLGVLNFSSNLFYVFAYSFCGGVLVAHLHQKFSYKMNGWVSLMLLAVLLVLVSSIRHEQIPLPDFPIVSDKKNWYVAAGIMCVSIVIATNVNIHHRWERFLEHYGTVSYSTYLYHNIFVAIAVLLLIRWGLHDGSVRLFFTFLFTLVASYVVASLSYRYVEAPSISMGRKLLRGTSPKADVVGVSAQRD